MSRLKIAAFSLALFASVQINGAVLEQQEMQLSRGLKMLYADLQEKGDESKKEYVITDPHFILDLPAQEVTVESDLKGTLNLVLDYKNNKLHSESDGINHIIINKMSKYPKEFSNSKKGQLADYTLEGKIIKDMTVDFKQAKPAFFKLTGGEFSKGLIVDLLSSVKESSSTGTNVKVKGIGGYGKELLESFKYNYQHLSSDSPERFSLSVKTTDDNGEYGQEIPLGSYVYRFPSATSLTSVHNFSAALPDFKKIADFIHSENLNDISTWSFNFDGNDKSKIVSGSWKGSGSSVKEGENALKYQHNFFIESTATPDWVSVVQNVKKEPIEGQREKDEAREDAIADGIMNWLISPKTTPFLKLLPLESKIASDTIINYSAIPLSVSKLVANLSWLSKGNGLKVNFDYANNALSSVINLVGGKESFNYAVELYNALSESVTTVFIMPKLSEAARDDLYKTLLNYAEDPTKGDSELKFSVKYNDDGVTIGKKSFYNLLSDLAQFRERHFSSEAGNY